jgi:hypothetical protein
MMRLSASSASWVKVVDETQVARKIGRIEFRQIETLEPFSAAHSKEVRERMGQGMLEEDGVNLVLLDLGA